MSEITPTSRMIPWNTELSDENYKKLVDIVIPQRREELGKLKMGDIEESLWLMEQFEHIKKLQFYNKKIRDKEGLTEKEKYDIAIGIDEGKITS